MPRLIKSEVRKIIFKIVQFLQRERDESRCLVDRNKIVDRVAAMTGVSRGTVIAINKEGLTNNGVWRTPGKGKGSKSGRPLKVNLDDFDKCAIRNIIHNSFAVKKEAPTLRKLLIEIKTDLNYTGGKDTLRKNLIEMGFEYKKLRDKRSLLIERYDIAAWRSRYLRAIDLLRKENPETRKHLIYLDESYIHTSYRVKKCWRSDDEPGPSSDISMGERYIIVHAGGEQGFIPNALLAYKSKDKKADYHHDMNSDNFKKWTTEKLIPNLPGPSVIIMDNASYHCVQLNKPPTMSTRKNIMQEWLRSNGISFTDEMTKAELMVIIKNHKQPPVYEIDQMLEEHGHSVLRLPPYHCDMNPIELIWSLGKRKFAAKNINREKKEIPTLIEEAFSSITVEDWKKECDHVKNIEEKYRQRDPIVEMNTEELIISVGGDDSSTDSEIDPMEYRDEAEDVNYFSGIEFLTDFSDS